MHIEFTLPNGAGGLAAGHALSVVKRALTRWAGSNGNPAYTSVISRPYTLEVRFDDPVYYTQFVLTFDPNQKVPKYKLINEV